MNVTWTHIDLIQNILDQTVVRIPLIIQRCCSYLELLACHQKLQHRRYNTNSATVTLQHQQYNTDTTTPTNDYAPTPMYAPTPIRRCWGVTNPPLMIPASNVYIQLLGFVTW